MPLYVAIRTLPGVTPDALADSLRQLAKLVTPARRSRLEGPTSPPG